MVSLLLACPQMKSQDHATIFNLPVISANRGIFNDVISKTINVQQLMAQSGLFETVQGKNGEFFNVLALDVNMNRAQVGTLSVDRLILRGTEDSIMYTFNDFLGKPEATKISAEDYDKYFFNGKNIAAHTITADEIMAQSISASEITADDLRGINGWINLHDGTFAFYGKTNTTDEVIKNKNLIDTYIGSWDSVTTSDVEAQTISDIQNQLALDLDGTKGTSGESLKFKLAMNFTPTSLSQAQLKNKIEELEPYSNGLGDVLEDEQKKTLKDLITSMYYYIIWLDVNDKINKDKEAPSKLLELSDEKLISKFNAYDNEYISISNEILKIREYLTIKNSSESGLMAWDGSKLTVRGDIIATSLTLGPGVNIETGNISGLKDYVTTNNLEGKLKDYTTTVDMKKEGLAFIVSENGSIGNYDSSRPLPTDAKGYFCVNKEGLMVAQNAVVYGTIYAQSGSFTGDVVANSLTLGSSVTIPYKNLSDSPDLGIYISKDGEIGTISSDLTAPDGAKGYFKVSTNGLLIADNAYISGTIYAQNGTFAGELKAAKGSFTGELKAATGTFSGKLSAATGSFTGEITADKLIANTAGTIAGWTITSDALSKNQGYNTSGGAYFGISGLSISDKFVVSSDGVLNATGATISGDITASSGKIGGYKIENGRLYNHMYGAVGSSLLGYSCGFSVNGGTDHTLWAGNENFYVNMDGSMHCSNADITGSITASGDNSSISTINGNTRVTLNNGRLVISNGDPSNAKTYRALIGLDNEGNNAWVCMYGTDGYVSDPPVMLSFSGVKGWITNSESSNYRPAICTSTAKENSYVSIICTNGTNQVLIRGLYNTDSYKDYTIKVTTSDARLKNNIASTKVTNALQQLLKINHREFNWKSSGEYTDIGYIAQELETINPRLVMKPVSKDGYYEIDTFYMTSLITKSIQEMYAELKEENYKLKNELDSLKKLYKVNNN